MRAFCFSPARAPDIGAPGAPPAGGPVGRRCLLLGSTTLLGRKAADILRRDRYCLGCPCLPAQKDGDGPDLRDGARLAALACYEQTDTVIWNLESLLPYLALCPAEGLLPAFLDTLERLAAAGTHIALLYTARPADRHPQYAMLAQSLTARLAQLTPAWAVYNVPALYGGASSPSAGADAVLADAAALYLAQHLGQRGAFTVRQPSGLDGADVTAHQTHCVFELVYRLEPAQSFRGQNVAALRYRLGQALAGAIPPEVQAQVDCVCPVPRTGLYYGMGLAQALGKPYVQGLLKLSPQERSFQLTDADVRKRFLWTRLSPLRPLLEGRRLALVDEAIFTGATLKVVCEMLWECGVKALYLCIPTPKCRYHCNYLVHPPRPMLLEYLKEDMLEEYFNCNGVYFQTDEGFKAQLDAIDPAMCAECFWGGDEQHGQL